MATLMSWLLLQCGSPETEARQQCMTLFIQFASLLPSENIPGPYSNKCIAICHLSPQEGSDLVIHAYSIVSALFMQVHAYLGKHLSSVIGDVQKCGTSSDCILKDVSMEYYVGRF